MRQHFDQAGCVSLVPRARLDSDVTCACKGEEGTGHEGGDYDFVDAHVGFVVAGAGGDFDCCSAD